MRIYPEIVGKWTRRLMVVLLVAYIFWPYIEKRWITSLKAQNIFDAASVTIVKVPMKKIEWSGSNPIYIGENKNGDATDGDTDWLITQLTWSGSTPTIIRQRTGAWTGHANLFP